jgi:hypothetical protein
MRNEGWASFKPEELLEAIRVSSDTQYAVKGK